MVRLTTSIPTKDTTCSLLNDNVNNKNFVSISQDKARTVFLTTRLITYRFANSRRKLLVGGSWSLVLSVH
jgi:hypothetical protein